MRDIQRGGFVVAHAPTRYLQLNLYIQKAGADGVGKWTLEARAGDRPDIYVRKLIGFGTWWSPTEKSIRAASKEWQITSLPPTYRVQISTHPIIIPAHDVDVPHARLDFNRPSLDHIEEAVE